MKLIVKYLIILLIPFGAFGSDREREQPAPTVMVIFGATGDLTSKKILPAIEHLAKEGQLPEQFAAIGVARKSEEVFRQKISSQIYYAQGDFDEDVGYERLAKLLNQIDKDFGAKSNRIYFLSTPPKYFSTIVEKLHQHNMIYKLGENQWSRLLIEKPFGTDLQSAIDLQKNLSKYLDESQIYRIDHYLGKEGVKNFTDFRLAQTLESVWNHKHIDRVQLTISEDIGIGSRAQFWEETGLLRDIVQNHLMQLLSLVAMEVDSEAVNIEEKIKVLHAIRPLDMGSVMRGQYGPGEIKGAKVPGYKDEEGVRITSMVETYFAATLFIDNERWKGVPFTIQAGKRLPTQLTEIVVHFKSKETLHIRIQPKPAIFFEGSSPFSFEPSQYSEAYQKLIVDCMKGDQSSFVQGEEQLAAWRLLTPVLEQWKTEPHISTYPAGTWPSSKEIISVEPLPSIHSHFLPHEENGRYYNRPEEVGETSVLKSTFSTIFYLLQGSFERPSLGDLTFWHRTCWAGPSRSVEPQITWMGHASVLIQMEGINLLLDPTYGFITPCFIRHTKEPIAFEKLPPIDALIVSHNHADHFDKATIKKIARKQIDFWGNPCDLPNVFIPHQLEKWFHKNGYPNASGKKWWERSVIQRAGRQVVLTAVPARHWSQSNLADKNLSLWMGVVIESEGFRIYFAGDTGFDREMFEEIRKQFGVIDIAILPIAPEGYTKNHLTLEEALDAFQLLGAKKMIPIHYGAYRTGTEKIEEPLIRLLEAIQVRGLEGQVIPLPLGGTYSPDPHIHF